jgi:6,7-dimethyl-8-ribityllumazine synthase
VLSKTRKSKISGAGLSFAIIASKYNELYVDSMVNAAHSALLDAGALKIHVVRVPGAFEIPAVAARLAKSPDLDLSAIICLGVILRGATTHAQNIAEAVSHGLVHLQVLTEMPVIHEVLLLENRKQAEERCLDQKHNRGMEAAMTALEMARIMRERPVGRIGRKGRRLKKQ